MKDIYKSNIIQDQFAEMAADKYYIVRLKGDSGKSINLDWHALRLLQAYYDGIITVNNPGGFGPSVRKE